MYQKMCKRVHHKLTNRCTVMAYTVYAGLEIPVDSAVALWT